MPTIHAAMAKDAKTAGNEGSAAPRGPTSRPETSRPVMSRPVMSRPAMSRSVIWRLVTSRLAVRAGLLLLSVVLLSLSMAPVYQFYLAWIGLVPWLAVVGSTRTKKQAFLCSWAAGTVFFAVNMWWLWPVTGPGMVALVIYLGLFFGVCAWILVGTGLIAPSDKPHASARILLSVILIAVIWTALEYVRGNWSMFGRQGLPWLYLGNSQSPLLTMCQVADIGGVYAVTFWIVLVNALVYWAIVQRRRSRVMIPAFLVVLAAIAGVAWYGTERISQTSAFTRAGPAVLVIQPSIPQSNTGVKGAPPEEIVRFHVETTRKALAECAATGRRVDLVAWSETMMPPMNTATRDLMRPTEYGKFIDTVVQLIARIASEHRVAIVTGATFADQWHRRDEDFVPADRRNSAYFFDSSGLLSEKRYDKIHLVPFGEFIPWSSIGPVYRLLVALGPNYYEDYVLTPGTTDNLTVFELDDGAAERANIGTKTQADRFVVPICFEDIDPPLVAQMFRAPDGVKRADFIVNLTNDGWFTGSERGQHLQAAVFRSIENRVPTARSVNTGISGFIDSIGRVHQTVAPDQVGFAVSNLTLDSRVTFYTRHGDAFVLTCAAIAGAVVVAAIGRWIWQRKSSKPETSEEAS